MIRTLETEHDRQLLLTYISKQPLPLTVSVNAGGKRSQRQNRLQRQWINDIAAQMGDHTAEEVRGLLKLTYGVPILRAEDDGFRAEYDRIVKPLPYETKLALMREPFDFPVTRLMTTKQHAAFLDAIAKWASEQGYALTDPEALSYAA